MDRIEIVHAELEAVDRAVSMLETNDLAVVLADDVPRRLERSCASRGHGA